MASSIQTLAISHGFWRRWMKTYYWKLNMVFQLSSVTWPAQLPNINVSENISKVLKSGLHIEILAWAAFDLYLAVVRVNCIQLLYAATDYSYANASHAAFDCMYSRHNYDTLIDTERERERESMCVCVTDYSLTLREWVSEMFCAAAISSHGGTENAGVENAIRAKLQGQKMQE